MICVICGMGTDSIEEAVDQGWIPYFYDGQIESGPARLSRMFRSPS
ncbi:MAG: hypothetical protein HN416_13640 [Nitrospina sp.]|nr:hypothetical protein [Nitrospina sp.]